MMVTNESKGRHWSRYPAYRHSGAEWLGRVPAHWAQGPLFTVARERDGKNSDAQERRVLSLSYGRIVRRDVSENSGLMPESFDTYQVLSPGDIVLRLTDLQNDKRSLRVGLVEESGIITSAYVALAISARVTARYLFYLLHAYDVTKVFYALGGGVRQTMRFEDLKWLPVLVPPREEQRAISEFLDRKTAKIDALVAKKERLITLLQEKRAALVAQTVTKGLDTSVLMKDSGVEWLGRIPQHWYVMRVRELAESLQTGPFGSELHADQYVHAGVPVINPANLRAGQLVPDLDSTVDANTAARLAQYQLAPHDVLFARRGEMGRCGMATQQQAGWICGTGCLRLRVRAGKAVPQFLLHLLSTARVKDWLELRSVGSTMQNLNTSVIGSLPVALPPLREQQVLSAHLDGETAQIDRVVAQVDTAIDRLREFRLALVAAAVTGEIDVHERAAA